MGGFLLQELSFIDSAIQDVNLMNKIVMW